MQKKKNMLFSIFIDCQGWRPAMWPARPEIYVDEGDPLELTCTSAKPMTFYYPKDDGDAVSWNLKYLLKKKTEICNRHASIEAVYFLFNGIFVD